MTDHHDHHDHSHAHGHHHSLNAAFWLTAVFAIVEVVGGVISNSLALLADAVHMISDVAALGLAMLAQRIAARPAHAHMTFGYGRAKVIVAQLNGMALWLLSGWIVWEAMGRVSHPPVVHGEWVIWVAGFGLLINLIIMRWLHGSHDINTRAAYWHVMGDALGSVAALVSGIVILSTGWMLIDPILSLLVAAILAWGGWRLVRETTLELMEALPNELDCEDISQAMRDIEGVVDVHHIHLWRLPSNQLACSAHIQLDNLEKWADLLPLLLETLQQKNIEHVTLQPELTCYDDAILEHC